jgi:glycine C-acetyltransferase/8-amino-7-oxononanoate synthase
MIEIEARLQELTEMGLRRRTRLVSGPQGPHVVVDGKPVLLLCSNNYLGLADHPRVRQAAGEAAMRWGVGAGASRLVSGTMTVHRRLEDRLAAFKGRESALLFGSGYLANAGVVAALARPGDVVFSDEFNHASLVDGCRLSRAEVFVYDHGDVEHLAWGIEQAEGRGALIATDSVFSMDGDVAPLQEIVELAAHHGIRVLVDEAHATGTVGPGGRGALAEVGLEEHVDVIVGTLGKALGSYGAFVACDRTMARYLMNAARTFIFSTALPPPAVAGALAALDLIEQRPRLVDRLQANASILRDELARQGFAGQGSMTQIVPLVVGDAKLAVRICDEALTRGVFAQAIRPPTVPPATSRLRLAVMASHREPELRGAARTLAAAVRATGHEPGELAAPAFVPFAGGRSEFEPALSAWPAVAAPGPAAARGRDREHGRSNDGEHGRSNDREHGRSNDGGRERTDRDRDANPTPVGVFDFEVAAA